MDTYPSVIEARTVHGATHVLQPVRKLGKSRWRIECVCGWVATPETKAMSAAMGKQHMRSAE
jgi:hypothetical protein